MVLPFFFFIISIFFSTFAYSINLTMAKKVLYINQEIFPYVPESEMSVMGKEVPHRIQEGGYEIRTFMPKWGNINERRGNLHPVIRLSGMNFESSDFITYLSQWWNFIAARDFSRQAEGVSPVWRRKAELKYCALENPHARDISVTLRSVRSSIRRAMRMR